MKCPKCHYLSFDPEPRCRNCGYDLALDDVDVPIKSAGEDGPLVDLELRSADHDEDSSPEPRRASPVAASAVVTPPAAPRPVARSVFASASAPRPSLYDSPLPARELPPPPPPPAPPAQTQTSAPAAANAETDRQLPELTVFRTAPPKPAAPPKAMAPPTTELPLFVKGLSVEEPPAIAVPSEPRPPLAVRRKPVEPAPAPRPAPSSPARKLGPLDRDLLEDLQRLERAERRDAAAQARAAASSSADDADRVGAGKRLSAALIDGVLLGSLATGIVGLTIRWCDLTWAQASVVPIAPTAAFIALVFVGYLLMFTAAGGQTLGKMVLGIRVVGDDFESGSTLGVGRAALRSFVTLPSVLALGAGFVPALMGDERAVHDRVAHTRVVRA